MFKICEASVCSSAVRGTLRYIPDFESADLQQTPGKIIVKCRICRSLPFLEMD